jgi:hypothetical protein
MTSGKNSHRESPLMIQDEDQLTELAEGEIIKQLEPRKIFQPDQY